MRVRGASLPSLNAKICASRVSSIESSSAFLPKTQDCCRRTSSPKFSKQASMIRRILPKYSKICFEKWRGAARSARTRFAISNGHLFEEATVFELTEQEIGKLAVAGEADWQFIQPSIMGNLFERGLDPDHRAQLGAHYTSEEDIKTLVEPVLMAPLRREWSTIKGELAPAFVRGEGKASDRAKLSAFHDKLAAITVLDPACGSGNFLYVSLQLLLDLEKELITFATQLGFKFEPRVDVQQLKAIELNAYAFELAQVSVQIGYLKWRRDNGFLNEREPVLQNLENFQNEDPLLVPHFL